MASQAISFAELLGGGLLITMGISGESPQAVLAGKGGHVAPIAATGSAGTRNASFVGPSGVTGASPTARAFVQLAESQRGVKEGSPAQAGYAGAAGISAAQAWCAAFVTWALQRVGISPPADPAAVSSWEHWSGGLNLGTDLAAAKPGDLIAFNGQHMGIYLGGGRMISGNWSNEVAIAPVSAESEPITAIIRVQGLYNQAARAVGRAAAESLGLKGQVR